MTRLTLICRYATIAILVSIWATGCSPESRKGPAQTPTASKQGAEVVHFGVLREIMHEGKMDGLVTLDESTVAPHTYGVGAIAGLNGEITIVDGTIWLSYPEGETAKTEQSTTSEERACLLVTANVREWRSISIKEDVPFEGIDEFVKSQAESVGLGTDKPFAFKVEGKLTDLDAHVIDGKRLPKGSSSHEEHMKAAVKKHFDSVDGTLVGFYSREHKGVWTHHDSDTHIHAVIEDAPLSGHVDGVTLTRGSTLFLPK